MEFVNSLRGKKPAMNDTHDLLRQPTVEKAVKVASLRSVYLRMEDGGLELVIFRDGGADEVFQLRPEQLAAIARDAAILMWRHFDLTERK